MPQCYSVYHLYSIIGILVRFAYSVSVPHEDTPMGRPKLDRAKSVPVRLDMQPRDHKRLVKQAEKRRISMASMVRMVIVEWLDQQERSDKQ
jgi:hypothetical protein